jgi:carbamoyl-phosphate synthase large subunit
LPSVTAVLFTCAGQRVDIVSAFGRAGATTLATDINPLAPALYHADRYALVGRVDDPDYVPQLRRLVEEHDVRLVVPLTDLDQELLAGRRDELAPALVLLPRADIVAAMADKFHAHELFVRRGIGSPDTWLPEDLPDDVPFPVFVKARVGFGSRHVYRCGDRAQLDYHLVHTPVDSMIQAACGGEEFSVDVFCDFDGNCLNAIPRTMIESRGGESIKGTVVHDEELIDLGRRVGEALPVKGPCTVQVFRDPDLGLGITDVNTRFGGAFPAPMYAARPGRSYPELIVRMARGERVEPHVGDFRSGFTFTRWFWQIELDEDLRPTGQDIVASGPRPPRREPG